MVVVGDGEVESGSVGDRTVEARVAIRHMETDRVFEWCCRNGEFVEECCVNERLLSA